MQSIRQNGRAYDRFPGHIYHVQEMRRFAEKKHRDWAGWQKLVAERVAELQAHPELAEDRFRNELWFK